MDRLRISPHRFQSTTSVSPNSRSGVPPDVGKPRKPGPIGPQQTAQDCAGDHFFVIGVLTILANLGVAMLSDSRIDEEAKKLQGQGMVVDQKAIEAAKRETQLTCAGFAAVGVVFIVMGFFVNAYPVPITISALVLYLAGNAISAVMDPTTIAQGIIIKIIIIAGLVRSIKAALEYERERSPV
jgi:hypothetical protein